MWSVKKKKIKHMSNTCIKITETLLNKDLSILGNHCEEKNSSSILLNLLTSCVKNLASCCVLLTASKYHQVLCITQRAESGSQLFRTSVLCRQCTTSLLKMCPATLISVKDQVLLMLVVLIWTQSVKLIWNIYSPSCAE